eukprot:707332-Pyramimonas_sp.AAC.1
MRPLAATTLLARLKSRCAASERLGHAIAPAKAPRPTQAPCAKITWHSRGVMDRPPCSPLALVAKEHQRLAGRWEYFGIPRLWRVQGVRDESGLPAANSSRLSPTAAARA